MNYSQNFTVSLNNTDFEIDSQLIAIIGLIILNIIIVGLPLTVLAIAALFFQVQKDHVAPIFVIHLHISDLIQICSLIVSLFDLKIYLKCFELILQISVTANVGFMMCIALERYMVIACPVWYRNRRSIKTTVLVCVVVWMLSILIVTLAVFTQSPEIGITFLLFPFPVLVFSLVGTIKSLSTVISVSAEEKCRIVGALVLVLCSYTVLFLPYIFMLITVTQEVVLHPLSYVFIHVLILFNPLADLFLYVFMVKGGIKRFWALLCCCRRKTQQTQSGAVTVDESS